MAISPVERLLASVHHPVHMALSTFQHHPFPLFRGEWCTTPESSSRLVDLWTFRQPRAALPCQNTTLSERERERAMAMAMPCPCPLARSRVKLVVPPRKMVKDGWESAEGG